MIRIYKVGSEVTILSVGTEKRGKKGKLWPYVWGIPESIVKGITRLALVQSQVLGQF